MSTEALRVAVYLSQMLLDFAAVIIGFGLSGVVRHGSITFDTTALISIVPVFLVISFYAGAYSFDGVATRAGIRKVLTGLAFALAFYALVRFAIKEEPNLSRTYLFLGTGLSAILLMIQRLAVVYLVREKLNARLIKRVLVIDGQPAVAPPGFKVIDIAEQGVTPDLNDPHALHHISGLLSGADRVVVSSAVERRESWSMYLKGIGCNGELLVPELHTIGQLHGADGSTFVGIPVSTGPLNVRNRVFKRVLDLSFTVPAIIALTPLLVLVAIGVKLSSPGPILFRQPRMGRGNRLFYVYKFRSMRTELTDNAGARSASRDDDRITPIGRIIRRTSLDELPQLFNVLEGDMSLVGPRPHALGSLAGEELFWHVDIRYWLRHAIKPGITGLAQVRGFRGATGHRNDLMQRLQADLEYVSNWTLTGDLAILLRTFLVVVHKNAY